MGKKIRQRYFSKKVLDEVYLIKFKFENYVEYIKGVLVLLFIVNEPIDKDQDAKIF